METSYHSICRWTFHAGKGGFVPESMIPQWNEAQMDTVGVIQWISKHIAPRLPDHVKLGLELHYDYEVNESNASEVAQAMKEEGIPLAMFTPGAHRHFAYGGIASLDAKERAAAEELGERTLNLLYGPLKAAWHPEPDMAPCLVLWNGSYGYDLASMGIMAMYQNLKESIARLCAAEQDKGGEVYIGIEPKPNEGHPSLLIPTVASAIVLWRRLHEEFGVSLEKKGVNKEFGHSEMIGLDPIYDTVEEIDNSMLVHMHLNSQGYNDGIILGGPGKYDMDHGVRINGVNLAIAGLIRQAGYARWKGHDIQPRAYDNVEQASDRVVRSILSWEACQYAADQLNEDALFHSLQSRSTAKAEDMIRETVILASNEFRRMYMGA